MTHLKTISAALVLGAAGIVGTVMADDAPPAVPATPAPVYDIISAQPFTLTEGYTSSWRKERPQVAAGYILVLSVNPDLVFPRNSLMPVLYGGGSTIEPINHGHESGKVIAILPSAVDQDGKLAVDLKDTAIWYGTPELPERVDAAKMTGERALAARAGIKPFAADKLAAALKAGGEQVALADKTALLVHLAPLITQHSPQEKEQADGYLALPAAEKARAAAPKK